MRLTFPSATALALVLALGLAGCSSDDPQAGSSAAGPASGGPTSSAPAAQPSTTAEGTPSPETAAGAWIDLAGYEADPARYHSAGDVVLFFNASWCPTCRTTVQSLDTQGAPPGLTVVSVDFDDSAQLRQTYGVTVQHTFVQVDAQGNEVTTFTGSTTGADIAAKTA